jgi:leukotriene-A4 hydrolase
VLDTRDLAIAKVKGLGAKWLPLPFALGKRDPILGSPLSITTTSAYAKVRITYRTQPAASGLQWLPALQVPSSLFPFMNGRKIRSAMPSILPLELQDVARCELHVE